MTEITCRLASSPADYRKCHALIRRDGMKGKLSFPTIIAEQDGKCIGIFGTHPRTDAVVAGPLFVARERRGTGVVAVRLYEAYERVLWRAGVRQYLTYADAGLKKWHSMMERAGMTPLGEHDGRAWFKRELEAA